MYHLLLHRVEYLYGLVWRERREKKREGACIPAAYVLRSAGNQVPSAQTRIEGGKRGGGGRRLHCPSLGIDIPVARREGEKGGGRRKRKEEKSEKSALHSQLNPGGGASYPKV